MPFPRTRFLLVVFLAAGAVPVLGQGPRRDPPPAVEVTPARGQADPDETSPVEQAQYTTPAGGAPRALPGTVAGPGGVVPAQYTAPGVVTGELPSPAVTLDIEGTEVSPTGQPVVYKLHVRNVSRAKAHNVTVTVTPPKNAEPVKWDPVPTHDQAASIWELKTLDPGQARTIEISYRPKPEVEEVKLQARVQYDFGRGMITRVAAPTLSVKKEGPDKLVVGDVVGYKITVTNTGRVTVRDIEVRDVLNKGLAHDDREQSRGMVDGRLTSQIDPKTGERLWTIPALKPGQQQVLEYRVRARDPGRVGSTVLVKAPDMEPKQAGLDAEVMTASLQVQAVGPAGDKGTVGQAAVYKVVVENKGSADLKNVAVKCVFPPDMRATKATNGGQPFRDTVQWVFREMKSGESKELTVGLTTNSPGTRSVQFTAKADKGPEQRATIRTTFAGVPKVDWDVDAPGVAAAGKTFTYRVTISNPGTAPGKAQVKVDLPPSFELVGTTPTSNHSVGPTGKQVIFPQYDVPAGKKTTLQIEVQARTAGEAKAIFWLEEDGGQSKREDKVTNVTGADTRSPAGPPPARKGDASSIGRRD